MSEAIEQSLQTILVDAHPDYQSTLPVQITASPQGITFSTEGYGDYSNVEGHGTPVFLELYQGRLRLLVWADINQEEPTHIIDLGEASEASRDKQQEILELPEPCFFRSNQ